MALISPSEYLKGKGKEEKKVSGGLISPSDYLSQTKPVAKPPMETFRPLGEDFFQGKITQPSSTQPPTPTPPEQRGGVFGTLDKTLGRFSKGFSDVFFPGVIDAQNRRMMELGTTNPIVQRLSTPPEGFVEKASGIAGTIAGYAAPYGAAYKAVSKPAQLGYQALAKGRDLGTKGRIGLEAAKGAGAGGIVGVGEAARDELFMPEQQDYKEHLKRIGLNVAAGAVLDPALVVGLPAAIKGAKKALSDRALNKEIKKFIERTETGMPIERTERIPFEGDIAAMTRKKIKATESDVPRGGYRFNEDELRRIRNQESFMKVDKVPIPDELKGKPVLFRRDVANASLENKPHGVYLSFLNDGKDMYSPHLDVGDTNYWFQPNFKKLLNVKETRVETTARKGVDKLETSAGVQAAIDLSNNPQITKYSREQVEGLIKELDPSIDVSRYGDTWELLEVYGAQLAKRQGYDGISLRSSLPDLSEIVALSDDAIKKIEPIAQSKEIRELPEHIPFKGDAVSMTRKTDGRPLLPRGDKSTVGDIVKRSDIVENLSKKLDIPLRVGKYGQKAHGIFKVKPEVIRTRLANDVPVIAHEVGHTLDKRFKLSSAAFDNELLEIGKATSGPGYSKNEIRQEGVAEFFRLMLTDPSEAVARTPKFYQQFASKVPSEVQQVLLGAQEQIQRYINQPVLAKSISELQIGGKDKFKMPTLDDLYTKFVEELHPIKKALEPLGEAGKKAFEGFRLLRGSAGRARTFLKQGIFDENFNKVGKSFDEVITPVRENLDEFRAYIKDKRALELDERGIMTGSDLSRAERNFNIIELESQYPQFKQAHQELKQYQDSLLDELVKSGVLDPADMATFKELNKEYVPFFRDMKVEKSAKKGTQMAGSPIKRIKGSDREIIDPLESIIKNTYQYTAIAQRNKSMLDLMDAITSAEGMGKLVEKVPTPMQGTKFSLDELRGVLEKAGAKVGDMDMDAVASIFRPSTHLGDNVISVLRKGKREFYELDPDLYLAVTAANQEQMNTVTRAFSFPTRMLRTGIVNTLEFWFKNAFRDQFESAIKSDVGYIPFVDMLKGMYHVLGRTDLYTKFLSSGGAQSFRQSLDRNYLQHDLRNMLAKSMKDKTMNIIKNPLEAMRALSELSEISTRVGVFRKGVMKDESIEGIKQAAMTSRDVIDFSRKGSIGKLINQGIPFWNAHIQGLDKTIRVFSNPKTAPKALAKSFAYITAPTIGLYQAFKDDPRYQELPQWDKDLFWHFWAGDKHFRLPIPFELGVMFKVIPERLMAYAEGQGEAFRELGKTTFEAVNVIPWPEDIALLSPWIQAISNKTFTGAPIVPRREQDLLPEDQIGPYTSTAAKAISKLPGIKENLLTDTTLGSPRKVDHIIRGYTGSLGQYATQAIDAVLDIARVTDQPPRPEVGLEDKALFKGFMGKTLTGRTDSIDKFYERYSELDRQYKSARKKAGDFEDLGEYKQFQKIARSMSELAEIYRAIEADPVMESKEKTEQIKELNLTTNNLARLALGLEPLSLEDFYPSKKK